MANTTFNGPVRSEAGFKVINKDSTSGAITETGVNINSTGQLVSLGTRKIQTFAIDLSGTNAASTTYADNDVLVELGELNTDHPDALVTASKFFIHKVVIGVTTAAASDANSLANLQLSATSGTATNSGISSGTEIVGAGVASFNPRISATDSVTEVDIDLDATAGTFHVFAPNISAAIASKNLYLGAGSTCDTALTAFRGTLEIEYSVY
jgi:hypothetical protein|tara:strand:- start:486 stop:1115 length:630 start_codon:yes stop_codon:yes gene_type:complete